jgi:hypothetical protein
LRSAQIDNRQTVANSNLAQHSVDVVFNGLFGNIQLLSDLLVGEATPYHFD